MARSDSFSRPRLVEHNYRFSDALLLDMYLYFQHVFKSCDASFSDRELAFDFIVEYQSNFSHHGKDSNKKSLASRQAAR